MKKCIVSLILLSVCFVASAKFRWGPSASVNFSDLHWKQQLVDSKMAVGFNVGVIGELMIPGIGFGVDFALQYGNRGGRVYFNQRPVWSLDGIGETNLRLHQLQIPINLRFKWTRMNGVENYVAPFVYAGPTFSFNLGHSNCPAIKTSEGSVGIQVGLGAELWKHFQLSGGYIWDVTYDLKTIKLDNYSARVQGWFINACYLF